jgi:outer membrane scaffolding protein for murein synthesis (MipA/OmpV family)
MMRRLFVLLLLAATPAAAQDGYYDLERWTDSAAAVMPAKPSSWRGALAAGVGLGPSYMGGDFDNYEAKPLPLAELEYRGTVFASTRKGVGVYFLRQHTFRLGARATVDFGRDSGDDPFLTGMPDVGTGIELGLLAEYITGPWRFRGSFRQDVADGHGGWLFNVDAAYGGRWSKNVSIIAGLETTIMSESYAQSYFGVEPADARAGRPAFSAGTGIRDVGTFVQMIFDISPEVFVSVDMRGNYLLLDAADSPLSVEDVYFFGGAMVGYRF